MQARVWEEEDDDDEAVLRTQSLGLSHSHVSYGEAALS